LAYLDLFGLQFAAFGINPPNLAGYHDAAMRLANELSQQQKQQAACSLLAANMFVFLSCFEFQNEAIC